MNVLALTVFVSLVLVFMFLFLFLHQAMRTTRADNDHAALLPLEPDRKDP